MRLYYLKYKKWNNIICFYLVLQNMKNQDAEQLERLRRNDWGKENLFINNIAIPLKIKTQNIWF